jgi:disease resistance protein RPM1
MELAVGASESAMRSLLGKRGSLLAQEYKLISSVRSEIQYMNNELSSMYAFLRKLSRVAAAGAAHDEQTKGWIEQVRDVAYDIEDCVDDFAHRLNHQPRGEGLLFNVSCAWYTMTMLWACRDIASRITKQRKSGSAARGTACRTPKKTPSPSLASSQVDRHARTPQITCNLLHRSSWVQPSQWGRRMPL